MLLVIELLILMSVTVLHPVKCYSLDSSPVSGSIRDKLSQMLGMSEPSQHVSTGSTAHPTIPDSLKDSKHGVVMGVSSPECDNAEDNLYVDWDGSPVNYTCFVPRNLRPRLTEATPVISCDTIPQNYTPQHHCMDEEIVYNTTLPTFEGHRPLWPVFGEYQFVPPQRWLHNIEHGAVVMLYHPCAEPIMVNMLKKIVKSCLWKYVITPWNLLPIEKPLALVAWGCRMQMTYVDPPLVRYFIRTKAFKGPEAHYMKQGQYTLGLLEQSQVPSEDDPNKDKVLC